MNNSNQNVLYKKIPWDFCLWNLSKVLRRYLACHSIRITVKSLILDAPNPKTIVVSSCSCLWPIHWSHVLSWKWICSWSNVDRRCSNCIWMINNFIAISGAPYIKGLTVSGLSCKQTLPVIFPTTPIHGVELMISNWAGMSSVSELLNGSRLKLKMLLVPQREKTQSTRWKW